VTREQIIAQAMACWISEKAGAEKDFLRKSLPMMDVGYFLKVLAQTQGINLSELSVALAGFGHNTTKLRALANGVGLSAVHDITDDIYTAAIWRNNRSSHPRIIALARGKHPGLSTLKHFSPSHSRELARAVLEWAKSQDNFANTGAQRNLLERLANSPQLESLRSLEMVADFLSSWRQHSRTNANDAPRKALPELGLLTDQKLFADPNALEIRLTKNLETSAQIMDVSPTMLRQRRSQIEKYRNTGTRTELLNILERVEALRLNPTSEGRATLELEEAQKVFRPPADVPDEPPPENQPPDTEVDDHDELDLRDLTSQSANALLDDRQQELEGAASELEEAWEQASEGEAETIEGEVTSGDDTRSFSFKVDRDFLDWLHTFCNTEVWGGLIESKEPSLELALKYHSSALREPKLLSPKAVTVEEGQTHSMIEMLEAFDREVPASGGPTLDLAKRWCRFFELRAALIPNLDFLVHFPLTWLAGKPALAVQVEEYLRISSEIYRSVQENYHVMANLSEGWARTVLEGLLALDVVQVRIELEDGRIAHKAVLLPTHPLHLWRYQRLAALLRGLGSQITDEDRDAILKDVMRPEHFLSVLWLGSIPDGRGADQILPIANEIHGLATFENLRNALSGPDGAQELANAVDRFTILARHHARPLRLAIVNPPEAGKLMAKLVNVLNHRRENTLPCLRVELFCTPDHAHRVQTALRLSDERELLEDKVASGRLEFKVHEKPRPLNELLEAFKSSPFHILAIFDEATIHIRRRSLGQLLPMSPFCVRRQIRQDRIRREVDLEPTSDEPPFSEYMQLINEAQRGQRDSSPHAWADAEALRKTVDQVLKSEPPAAHWVFLADRALPSEGRMQAVRLLQRRDGQRQVLLAAADYRRLAELIKPVFDRSNLSLSPAHLQRMLVEGVGLIGAGFLDLIRAQDGRPDANRVRGLAGMLLAARDYRQRHPDCLLVAVDSDLARLWLRLGRRIGERCDLLAVRHESDRFVVECIEVKTTEAGDLADDCETIVHARTQIQATLEACAAALPDNVAGQEPLSAPRCEMMKEIFVRACQARSLHQDLRAKWCVWLPQLFRQEGEPLPTVFRGEVIRVLLGCNEDVCETELSEQPFSITARNLTEGRIQDLIESQSGDEPHPLPVGFTAMPQPPRPPVSGGNQRQEMQPEVRVETKSEQPIAPKASLSQSVSSVTMPNVPSKPDELPQTLPWPPPVNALGMIGQAEAVAQLVAQVNFSRAAGRRFPDKLMVGPAGVGKSSLARGVARQLLSEEEILFNGADLQKTSMLVSRLQEKQKIPARPRGNVSVQKTLLFIDEVHAISSSVATALLSAMDDARVTTIDGVNYDFNEVIIMLATTDPGRLSEAFNSRPDKTYLRPYTLHELAGIVWLHGKENLGQRELTREACYEIAARMRCQPRRAVRALTQMLIPHFHGVTHKGAEKVDYGRIAEALTAEAMAGWFDAQGIDMNGLDAVARNYLGYLRKNGATSAERLQQALGITNRADFIEVDEYLARLGLITISAAGRTLTRDGSRYLVAKFDLKDRISRQLT
jgi:Holliday junction resolvasome RuvABC ATP-dependent DNA helicase subunit